jgi:UvrD-like helicase C-terminal domain
MANQPTPKSSIADEAEDVIAARQELQVLENLAQGVSDQISELSRKPQSLGQINNIEFALLENNHARLKAYQELARTCYGRTILGTEVDENNRPKGAFTYRITQANISFVEKGCFVLARNSRFATELVTAQPGDDRDVVTPGGDRYLSVHEVRVLDGPVSLRSPNQQPNFRSMAIRKLGLKTPIVLENLRTTIQRASSTVANLPGPPVNLKSFDDVDPTWLSSWSGVHLGDADEQSLGHQFMTRTTVDQERALNNPRGLTLVEGIAGAGKTSVALGRLKFFANFSTGEREYYGLQSASEKDFEPVGMMGFVLSHSLKRYLKETAGALELDHLPIKDFEEFRIDLANRFGIASRFRKKKGDGSSLRSRVNWLRALDVAMAQAAGAQLRENLARAKHIPEAMAQGISRLAADLLRADDRSQSGPFHLNGLATRVVGLIAEVEVRDQEDRTREQFRIREKADNERRRREEFNLEREMRRIQQLAERRIVSPLSHSLLSGLTSHDLFLTAVAQEQFANLIQESFSLRGDPQIAQNINSAVAEIRSLLSQPEGRPALTETDLATLVIFAAIIAEGFDYVDQSGALNHLYQIRRNTAVFIDEVQDFTEIEIVLMGMSATSAYNQITLSGDRCQQLQSNGTSRFEHLFPWVPKSPRSRTIFLDHNFRQRSELASLSSGLRSLLLQDKLVEPESSRIALPSTVYGYSDRDHFAEFILERIRSLPHHAAVAVVMPTIAEAQIWFDILNEDLSSYHRAALMSRRDDLTKRMNVHFTEVRETKGLEFDVVIVPDLGSYELDNAIGRNQVYVAISRAKQSLLVGCAANRIDRPEIRQLEQAGLVVIRDAP